jgi:hypothetical protein
LPSSVLGPVLFEALRRSNKTDTSTTDPDANKDFLDMTFDGDLGSEIAWTTGLSI